MSIEVQNVTKLYGEQKALDDVSFSIGTGEIVGFLGPNGAGKSTMMKILTCYIPQSEGTARVCGIDTQDDSITIRKKVGYLPEHNPLYLEMYVKEYLAFMAGVHKVSKDRIPEMIRKTGLEPEKHKKLGQLSKGYRQRAGLAAALLHDPEVLILDEPTTGLDPNQLVEIRNLIKEIGQAKTVMLSTHIMQEVELLCNRVIIINNGKIVTDSSTKVLTELLDDRVFIVEFDKTTTASQLKKLEGIRLAEDQGDGRKWQLTALKEHDIRNTVFKYAVSQEMVVLELRQKDQKLENVFQKLTQKHEA
ncbi:MAG TPA: gliding motility-associated ABC transporter ATP-binding subunit GldA [Cryomorphaceae bacterium]|nr:gliding motility-associated ABC transporter ATP-binding subunit GldA [Owenweeksia sp.]MBF98218.1 gliding motility-associated ABC transporter ATP-binding subunit GldA [Owenweeksia sp.]HAD95999.1 gliding motility-associated ABC transporter ATP-binding subunit GldA [Cryomorphaceae bacterium]|tara:strand:- start:7478 stop:8389 length:912 start_codon:yes stop_codon:yes gene_type:complete